MSEVNINIPILGSLKIKEVYEYYDQPLLYSCENEYGQTFIALSVEDFSDKYRWFYLPVSHSRFNSIRQGVISLQQAFLQAEGSWIWDVYEVIASKTYTVEQLSIDALNIDDLPCEGEKLNFAATTLPQLPATAIDEAVRSQRDVLDLSICSDNYHSTEVDAETLGLILLRTQGLIHALGHDGQTTKGRIPKEIIGNTTMKATFAFAASFGIRLESAGGCDLFGDTRSSIALDRLMSLLSCKDDTAVLVEILKSLGIRASSRYRNLLKTIRDTNATLLAEWGSPSQYTSKMQIMPQEASKLLSILNFKGDLFERTHKLEGRLEGIYTGNNTFWFQSHDGIHYKGVIHDSLKNRVFEVPTRASVVISEEVEVNEITQQEHVKFTLQSIDVLISSPFNLDSPEFGL